MHLLLQDRKYAGGVFGGRASCRNSGYTDDNAIAIDEHTLGHKAYDCKH